MSKGWFSVASNEQLKEISRKGGKAAHSIGRAHKWSSDEARAAGRKGGQKSKR